MDEINALQTLPTHVDRVAIAIESADQTIARWAPWLTVALTLIAASIVFLGFKK